MKSIIKEFFLGYNGTRDNIKDSEEYGKIYEKLNDVYERLKSKLPEELREDFNLLVSLFDDREIEAADNYYINGVKTGILLGIEACN